jgi:nucleoside phosphorylase
MFRVAIVAALEREVRPLIREWSVNEREIGGRRFRFFENENVVLVCGGIGAEPARRAAEAVIATYAPAKIYSVGFAGALDASLRGEGALVSFGSVASPAQKASLQKSFAAQAVDMEAASVARAAEARGVEFAAVKVISDEFDFSFPSMERFIDSNGQFLQVRFAGFVAVRPWLWLQVARLARNSNRASLALCDRLEKIIAVSDSSENSSKQREAVDKTGARL